MNEVGRTRCAPAAIAGTTRIEALEPRRLLALTYAPIGASAAPLPDLDGQFDVRVAYRSGAGLLVWAQPAFEDAGHSEVMARRIDDQGQFLGDTFQVNTDMDGMQFRPTAGIAADGSFVVSWFDSSDRSIRFPAVR